MCPMTTGAMKQTVVDGRWIHTVCALYLARVSWDDPQTMAPIILRDVPPQSWGSQVEDSWCYPFPESPPPVLSTSLTRGRVRSAVNFALMMIMWPGPACVSLAMLDSVQVASTRPAPTGA